MKSPYEDDAIVAEVRKARDAFAARFNYDLKAMVKDIRSRQGKNVVTLPPKRRSTAK